MTAIDRGHTPLGKSLFCLHHPRPFLNISINSLCPINAVHCRATREERILLLRTNREPHLLPTSRFLRQQLHSEASPIVLPNMTSFPLHCNICPKHPNFSDVSHLLTHVGSKGHLSHYFRVQVRSRQEPSIREQLHKFDAWYDENQIEKLLSQRMILKESKAANARNRGPGNLRSRNAVDAARPLQGRPGQPPKWVKDESILDPQLSQPLFLSNDITPREPQLSPLDPVVRSTASNRRRQILKASRLDPESVDNISSRPVEGAYTGLDNDSESSLSSDSTSLVSPLPSAYPEPPLDIHASPIAAYRLRPDREEESHGLDDADGETDDEYEDCMEEKVSDATRLKGIYWPGMDLFDSASPTAKRKRNQKKDGSILEQMKANSAIVEPTELIFWAGGDLKMKRQITGQVESSPFKQETPRPKRLKPQLRKVPLQTISANVPRTRRNAQARDPYSSRTKSEAASSRPPPAQHQGLGLDRATHFVDEVNHPHRRSTLVDNGQNWTPAIFDHDRQPNADFRVFEDNRPDMQAGPVLRSSVLQNSNMNYPFLQLNELSKGPRYHAHGLPYMPLLREERPTIMEGSFDFGQGRPSTVDQFSHSNCSGYTSATPIANKENLGPMFDRVGQVDRTLSNIGLDQQHQQYFSVQGSEAAQFHTNMPPHMDFAAYHGSDMFSRSVNPLAFNFQQQQTASFSQRQQTVIERPPRTMYSYRQTRATEPCTTSFEDDSGDETVDELVFQGGNLLDDKKN